MCVYHSTLYNFIIDGPLALKNTLKIVLVFKHPLKQSKKANMLQKNCAMTPFSYSHLDGCYFPLILLLHRGNEAVLICCLLVSIFGLFSDVYFTKMIRIELALDHTCYPYIIRTIFIWSNIYLLTWIIIIRKISYNFVISENGVAARYMHTTTIYAIWSLQGIFMICFIVIYPPWYFPNFRINVLPK